MITDRKRFDHDYLEIVVVLADRQVTGPDNVNDCNTGPRATVTRWERTRKGSRCDSHCRTITCDNVKVAVVKVRYSYSAALPWSRDDTKMIVALVTATVTFNYYHRVTVGLNLPPINTCGFTLGLWSVRSALGPYNKPPHVHRMNII